MQKRRIWFCTNLPSGIIIEQELHYNFPTTNNQVEYKALIARLKVLQELKIQNLNV